MTKIAAKFLPGVSYRQVVLTLPEQLRIPFHNHPNQSRLYSQFMSLAHTCLAEVIQERFKSTEYKIALIVFLHTNGRNGSYNPHLHVILAEGAFLSLAPWDLKRIPFSLRKTLQQNPFSYGRLQHR